MLKDLGFTLIELLVTLSIIAVLFGTVITSASIIQKNARDVGRRSDLTKIQAAMEHYYADQSNYASTSATLLSPPNGASYLKKLPADPSGAAYGFEPKPTGCDNSVTSCTSYCIYAKLESSPSASVPSPSEPCTNTAYNLYIAQP